APPPPLPRAGPPGRASRSWSLAPPRPGRAGASGRTRRRATPRRRGRSRTPPRTAYGSGGRSPDPPSSVPPSSASADRHTVEGAVEVVAPRPEVAGADRRDEARVERLGQVQGRVDAVPAEADRQLVSAEFAGVEEAEDLDAAEMRLEERTVLALVVFPEVP